LQIFCTQDLKRRARLPPRRSRESFGPVRRLIAEQEALCALFAAPRAVAARERTQALVTIAQAVTTYRARKSARLLDMTI